MKPETRFGSIADVKRANAAAGLHFFERDTMRFFASRVEGGLLRGRFFVTSEQAPTEGSRRRYTLREALQDGRVETVGEFQAFDSPAAAADVVRSLPEWDTKHVDAIRGRLGAEQASNVSDAELERCLGPCVMGPGLVRAAQRLRDAGILTERDIRP